MSAVAALPRQPAPAGPTQPPAWVHLLEDHGVKAVAVVGGSGRLGSLLTHFLVSGGVSVRVIDAEPCVALPGVTFLPHRLAGTAPFSPRLLDGVDAVVHLAALHGAHLAAGAPRSAFWQVNVRGAQQVFDAAAAAEVPRVVLAGSTSVYGSGSPPGSRAHVLDESTSLAPEDVYDLTKIAAEHALAAACPDASAVSLRFGRFFFPSRTDYHLRKLSTGLDARDACQAVVRALVNVPLGRFDTYCVASDLPMSRGQRERLGLDAVAVLSETLPELLDAAQLQRITLPDRVGKSVDSSRARAVLGYLPERALDWVARTWLSQPSSARPPRLLIPSWR
jgi:UDP-glucose 4-epimerase